MRVNDAEEASPCWRLGLTLFLNLQKCMKDFLHHQLHFYTFVLLNIVCIDVVTFLDQLYV